MSDIFDQPFRKIAEEAASSSPTPGGGSVSAMVGILGLAMTSMVGKLTIGKKKYIEVEEEVKKITARAADIMTGLEILAKEDIEVFNRLMDAYRMPKETDREKSLKNAALEKALKEATLSPLKAAGTLLDALSITSRLAQIGNKMAISDAGVAAYVCEAALNAVLLNVDINMPLIKDKNFIEEAEKEKNRLIAEAGRLKDLAVAAVRERM